MVDATAAPPQRLRGTAVRPRYVRTEAQGAEIDAEVESLFHPNSIRALQAKDGSLVCTGKMSIERSRSSDKMNAALRLTICSQIPASAI
jgi:hypothetical protein